MPHRLLRVAVAATAALLGAGVLTLGLAAVATASPGAGPAPAKFCLGGCPSTTNSSVPPTTGTTLPPSPSARYYVALGDSLGAGTGADPGQGYVDDIESHFGAVDPGLVLDNFSCGGATTDTMLNGGGSCDYTDGTQLATADTFLRAHAGHIAFVTIDIGANNVDQCVSGGSVDVACVEQGLTELKAELPVIMSDLRAAAGPEVPVVGMTYYDPFLVSWLSGASGQSTAKLSDSLAVVLNSDITTIDATIGPDAGTANVQGAFATLDFAMTGDTWDGTPVPHNVDLICVWTHMCTEGDFHANDTGHAVLAGAFEPLLTRLLTGHGRGDLVVGATGTVRAFGTAASFGSLPVPPAAPIVGMSTTPDGRGYWLVGRDGGVFAFGDAGWHGSLPGLGIKVDDVVGMAATPDGGGYWLLGSDGGVFAFGDASYLGRAACAHATAVPAGSASTSCVAFTGIASDGSGSGYWVTDAEGAVADFGDAGFLGAMPKPPAKPIVGMAASPDGNGYWLVGSDGGVFAFGDALFEGSAATLKLAAPVTAIAPDLAGGGYWLIGSDGGQFAYGTPFVGSGVHALPVVPQVGAAAY